MILVRDGELGERRRFISSPGSPVEPSAEHNAAGKVMKNILRQQATVEWEKRKKMGGEAKSKL